MVLRKISCGPVEIAVNLANFVFTALAIELSGAVCEIESDLRYGVVLLFFIIYT